MTHSSDGIRWLRWLVLDHLLLIVLILMVATLFSILFLRSSNDVDRRDYELQRSVPKGF
ncbi:hypothetical protein [Rhizobium binxianense]